MGRSLLEGLSQKSQVNPIGAEDNGIIRLVVEGDAVVEVKVNPRVEEGAPMEENVVLVDFIP